MILAILRAQFLSFRVAVRVRKAGTWLSAIPAIAFYLMWTAFAFGLYSLCSSLTDPSALLPLLAGALLAIFLYWQIAPVVTASMGASLDLQKLVVYPIALEKLFLVEVLLRFFTVGEMLVLLTGAAWGLLRNPVLGGWAIVPPLLAAWLLFIFFNLLIAAGVRSSIERFFHHRRAKEIGMLVFVLLCAAPAGLIVFKLSPAALMKFVPLSAGVPWGAAARIAVSGPGVHHILPFSALVIWGALAYAFGRQQFLHSLRKDPYAGRKLSPTSSKTWAWVDRAFRIPGSLWSDPLATLIEKELRSLSRSSGFRLAFVMGFTFGILIFLPQITISKNKSNFMSEHFLAWVSMYSVLLLGYYTFWNAFGFDRAAAGFYFSTPVSFRQVLLAKNLTAAAAQTIEVTLIFLFYLLLPLPFRWLWVLEAYSVTAVGCLYLFALGNWTSIRFPSPLDPEKMSRGGASRGKQMLSTLLLPVALLPVALAYWGRHVFERESVFYLLLLVAALIGVVFYWVGTDSAVELSRTRREQMLASLSEQSGPLSIT